MISPHEIPKHIYYKQDIHKAYAMGLETGISILNEIIGLSTQSQRYILRCIKKQIIEDKINAIMKKP